MYGLCNVNRMNEPARRACVKLEPDVAVVKGDQGRFRGLPIAEWGESDYPVFQKTQRDQN
jgi:hypothetical protein